MGLPIGDFEFPHCLHPDKMRDRIAFLKEELNELEDAAAELSSIFYRDGPEAALRRSKLTAEIFDGLLDLNYVSCGTAVMMGMPWEEGWNLVQAANMAKMRVEKGKGGKDDHHLSIVKPEGWEAPKIQELIQKVRADEISGLKYALIVAEAKR